MSGELASGLVGAAVGFAVGGPQGAMYGYAIGSAAGSILFAPKINTQGPRLTDLSIQSSAEGQPIYKIYGTMRTAGNVVWGKPIAEKKKKKKAGGKGGGGQTTTTYSYTVDFAVSLCEGPISSIRKIWADGKLIYDMSVLTAAEQAIVDGGGFVPNVISRLQSSTSKTTSIVDVGGTMRIYTGTETQLPDPLIESDLGVGNTPAYRGTAYIVFDNFKLADFGNRIPNITAEVVADGSGGLMYLGKVGPFDALLPPSPLYAGDARVEMYSHYVRPSGTLGVTSWGHDYASTGALTGDPAYIYSSGLYQTGQRHAIGGNVPVTKLAGYCDVPAYFAYGDAVRFNPVTLFYDTIQTLFIYAVSGSPPTGVLIGKVWPGDNVFTALDDVNGNSGAWYVGGEIWVYVHSTGDVHKATPAGADLAGATPAPDPGTTEIHGNVPALVSGVIRSVWIGPEEVYVVSGSANPYTLTVIAREAWTILRTVSLPISPSTASGLQPATRAYSPQTGLVYLYYTDAATNAEQLYVVDGTQGRALGTVTNTALDVYKSPNVGVQDGVLAVFYDKWTGVPSGSDTTPALGEIRYWSIDSISSNTVPLSTIVADICNSAGLDSSFINVTDLASTMVNGYIRNAQMTARAALEPLASGFFFDAVESGDKIVFKKRGGASVATIAYDDLGAASEGSQEDRVVTTEVQDNELPIELNMQYTDPARDFQIGSQRSRRQIPKSQKVDTMQMPISWSGTEAKQAVEKLHYTAWEERTSYAFSLPLKYLRLEPADVILLPVNGVNKRVQIKKTTVGSVIQCEASSDYAANYISESIASDNPTGPQEILVPGTTIMQILDIPILQDADNNEGFYLAAMGTGTGWTGAAILKSDDNVSFVQADSVTTESEIGSATTLLPSGPTTIWDDGSTVTVRLIKGALTSTTDINAMAGANTIAIGAPGRWEIVSFVTATLNGDGTYTLSRLLRGRLGTEWAVGTHVIGDAVVVIEAGTLTRIVPSTADIGVPRYYKAVSFGGDESDVITYTHQAVGLECYAPVHIRGLRNSPSTNDWTITWVRRTRIDGGWRDYVDVPLGELAENYEIDIMSGSTVKRTLTATSQTVAYTSAMQTTDFGSAQTTITVNIYQMSGTVGRGYVGTKTI